MHLLPSTFTPTTMTRQKKNSIRALFLLTVFTLNTVAGFACSLGVDMGYNTKHHEAGGKALSQPHKHAQAHKHSHAHKTKNGASLKGIKDDCCSDQVNDFAKLDKAVSYNNLLLQPPVFLIATLTNFFNYHKEESTSSVNSKFRHERRWRSLNDTDIRIAIQSFQI